MLFDDDIYHHKIARCYGGIYHYKRVFYDDVYHHEIILVFRGSALIVTCRVIFAKLLKTLGSQHSSDCIETQ